MAKNILVSGLGFRVEDLAFVVQGLGLRASRLQQFETGTWSQHYVKLLHALT